MITKTIVYQINIIIIMIQENVFNLVAGIIIINLIMNVINPAVQKILLNQGINVNHDIIIVI